ncbi:hypothetical protein [Streptomyces thermospinosisporus]|uniref:hypothetical protein n=1 Tax=Streptomyces thermospinosisporus TaxID=161482 RepID=UPI0031DFFF9D
MTFPIIMLSPVIDGSAGGSLFDNETLGAVAGKIVSCLVVWVLGRRLNRDGNEHTMRAVPMQWWAVTFVVSGGAVAVFVAAVPGTTWLRSDQVSWDGPGACEPPRCEEHGE